MRRALSAMPIAGADALAERAGRDVDERQARRRMAFEIGVELAQLQQLGAVEGAGLGPGGVENRRGVPLRQHEAIAARDAADPCGSKRISAKNSAAMRSAAEQHWSGWPLPASVVARIESMRSRVAMFFSAGNERGSISYVACEILARTRIEQREAVVGGCVAARRRHVRRLRVEHPAASRA